MVFIRKVRSKNKEYFVLIHSIRKGGKITQRSKYIGKELPSKKELDKDKKELLEEIKNPDLKRNKKIEEIKKKIIPILREYNIKKAGIFGSYARGDFKKSSDVDILVQPPSKMGLKFVEMNIELEKKLGKKVDIVTYKYISPYLKKYILEDEIKIL